MSATSELSGHLAWMRRKKTIGVGKPGHINRLKSPGHVDLIFIYHEDLDALWLIMLEPHGHMADTWLVAKSSKGTRSS